MYLARAQHLTCTAVAGFKKSDVRSSQGSQSIQINIRKPFHKSISINKLNLSVINVIDQSIEIDTHTLKKIQVIDLILSDLLITRESIEI